MLLNSKARGRKRKTPPRLAELFGTEGPTFDCSLGIQVTSSGKIKRGDFQRTRSVFNFFVELINKLQSDRWSFNLRPVLTSSQVSLPLTAHHLQRWLPDYELNLCPAGWPLHLLCPAHFAHDLAHIRAVAQVHNMPTHSGALSF